MSSTEYKFSEHKNNHIVIEASAGTGKTYAIEHMIPQFIENGISIEKIAVLTFTEKAAAELQDRIRKTLIRSIANTEIAQDKKDKLEEALDLLHNANIGTIHHFCRSILKKHSLALGFSAKFGEIRKASEEIETYFKKFWGKIEKDDSEELITLLRKFDFPKFKNILIELTEKTGGKKIKLLKKSDASGLEERFSKLYSFLANADLPSKNTDYSSKLQFFLGQNFSTDAERFTALTNTFFTKTLTPTKDITRFIASSNSISENEFEEFIESLRLKLENNYAVEFLNPIFTYANELIADYEKFLFSQDKISLDGLILQARRLLTDFPDIKKQIQKNINYLILDECQDTNPIQIDLVTQLFSGLSTGIIFVGDAKQSIYRFRQADLNSYQVAVNGLVDKKNLTLDTSYRSSKRLIDAFNFIFPHFESFKGLYKEVKANRTDDPQAKKNRAPLLLLGLDSNNTPKTQDELGNDYSSEDLRQSSIKEIIQVIKTITDNGNYLIQDKNEYRKIKYSDIAILANSNSSLNKLLREFSKNSISANVYKSVLFYSHKIVQAISHLLHSIENPNDSSSLYKTLASDLFLIPERILYQLSEAGELSYLFDSSVPEINIIYESLRKAHEKRYMRDISFTLHEVLNENQILEVLSIGFEGKRNLANIYHLSEILSFDQSTENLSFGEVVRNLKRNVETSVEQEIKLDNDKKDDSFNSVQLMTMHASKGLEFPVCILFDLAAKPIPNSKPFYIKDSFLREDPIEVELKIKLRGSLEIKTPKFKVEQKIDEEELLREKDRLLYVAFTRAKDYLVLPLYLLPKNNSSSLRKLITNAFSSENIATLLSENLAENFSTSNEKTDDKETEALKEKKVPIVKFEQIYQSILTTTDLQSKAGIKIQSYSSIARHLEPEEEYVKEKITSEKKVAPENNDNSPITLSSEKRGTTFGLLCHAVMENFDLKKLSNAKEIDLEVKRMVNEYYPSTGLNEIQEYTSKDAIDFCLATLSKSYAMNEEKTEFARISDWKYLAREKSFFYKLKSSKMDFLVGIGDGMFYWNDKYYLLDWKTNLIKPNETETIDGHLERKVKESYFYQYMIYSMNLIDSITPKKADKKDFWNRKFGGMLFIFMRVKEDNQGSFLVKPTYEEMLNFKKGLEN